MVHDKIHRKALLLSGLSLAVASIFTVSCASLGNSKADAGLGHSQLSIESAKPAKRANSTVHATESAPLNTASQNKPRVTMIGDSHTALAFGDAFYKQISEDFSVHLIASSSSRPKHWADQLFITPSKNGASEYRFGSHEKFHCVHEKSTSCEPGDKNAAEVSNENSDSFAPDEISVHGQEKKSPNLRQRQCCLSTEPLSELIAKDAPDYVVIALGANLHRASPETIITEIQSLLAHIDGRPCFWIAPPYSSAERFERQQSVLNYLLNSQDVKSKCTVYDSSVITNGITAADKVHYSAEQNITHEWAHDAAEIFFRFAKVSRK
jgi:hypothetical protein